MNKPTFSVIICTYYFHDRNKKLQKLVDALSLELRDFSHEVIIIDNGGGLLGIDTQKERLNLVIIKESKVGLSIARNTGVKSSLGNILVFFDDDIIPTSDYFKRLLEQYTKNIQVLCVGGSVVLKKETKLPLWMTDYFTRFIVPPAFPKDFSQKKSPFYIIGSNMTFRKEVFQEFGLFDTSLGRFGKKLLSGEDTEMILRIPEENVFIEPLCCVETEINVERLSHLYFMKRIYRQGISDALILFKNRDIVLYDEQELFVRKGFIYYLLKKLRKLLLFEVLCAWGRFVAFWYEICVLKFNNPLAYLSRAYGLTFTNQITLIKGLLNENSILKSVNNKKYFLKKNRPENYDRLSYIEKVEDFFSKNGIPVILPLMTKDKKLHLEYRKDKYTLYPYINGVQPSREYITDKQVKSLAETLANIHMKGENAGSYFKKEEKTLWDKEKVLKKIQEILDTITDKNEFDILSKNILNFRKEFVEKNIITDKDLCIQNTGLLHGDYHEQNVFFDVDGNISHVFDFEKSYYGSSYTELVRTLLLVCFNHQYNSENFHKARIFISTYNALYPIKKEDFESAYKAHIIKAFHSTWIEGEHYLKGNKKIDSLLLPNYQTLRFFQERGDEVLKLIGH